MNEEKKIISYKFFYKNKFGRLDNEIIEIDQKDNELAIATFESKFPDITWRSFIML